MKLETPEEFEAAYAERGNLSVERLRELGRVVLPCDCDYELCEGWQSLGTENARDEYRRRHDFWDTKGLPCASCWGWIGSKTDRVVQTERNPEFKPGAIITDGMWLVRQRAYHARCAPAAAARRSG